MSIEDNLENSKEQLIRNIDLLNDSINKNSNEIDKIKLIVLLIEKYNINPFANMKVKDVATDLGMNQNNANDLFRRNQNKFVGYHICFGKWKGGYKVWLII